MSATNESKALERLASQEIKQQIPVKLSSLSKESKTSKKSTVNLTSSTSLNSSSSKGITNLVAKPEAVQQLLPFKLSEDHPSSGTTKISPKHQQQHHKYPAPHHPGHGQHGHGQQYYQHAFDTRRSGSPPQPHHHHQHQHGGSLRYTNSTLPKTAKTTVTTNYGSSSGANSDDDKVIYF